jgi:drug/metabolite transporter (DMT)-like permease
VAIGGVNFVAVRFSNRELPPLSGAGIRFAVAAILLLVVLRARRMALPRGRALMGVIVYGVLAFGAAYGFAYSALTELPAGAGAVVFASYPLFTVFLAPLHRIERFHLRGLLGALLALTGIVVLANPGSTAGLPLLPVLAMVGSAISAAEAAVLVKKFPVVAPMAANTVAMATGAGVLFALSLLAREEWVLPQQSSTWLAVGYLAVIGSAGLFGLFLFVLQRWTATATSYATALLPVSAMVAGAVIAGEPITPNGLIGGVIVIMAVWVGALSGREPERAGRPPVRQERKPLR